MKDGERSLGQGGESLRHRAKRVLHELELATHPDFPNSPLVNSHIYGVDDRGVSPRNALTQGRVKIGPIVIDFRDPIEPLTSSEIKPQQGRG